jgi:hypothetical protein
MLKKFFLPSLIIALLLVSMLVVPQASAKPDPFIGVWTSIDVDGSSQTLTIGGGSGVTRQVRFHDDGATICGMDPDTGDFLSAASARGPLSVSGDTLSGDLSLYCQTSPPAFAGDFHFVYTYDPSTDTLTDWLGVVWSR